VSRTPERVRALVERGLETPFVERGIRLLQEAVWRATKHQEMEVITVDLDDWLDQAEKRLFRDDVARDPKTNTPLAVPVFLDRDGAVPVSRRRGQRKTQSDYACRARGVTRAEFERRARTAPPEATIAARFGFGFATAEQLSGEPDWESPDGIVGTEFIGGLPWDEAVDRLTPYKARGLSLQHGEFMRAYRGFPAISDSVDQFVNYLLGGTWEYEPPREVLRLPKTQLDAAGVDLDMLKRQADDLNTEIAVNQSVRERAIRAEQVRLGMVAGFCVHEFGFNLKAELGRRLAYFEGRMPWSVDSWITGERDELLGFQQQTSGGTWLSRAGRSRPVVDIRKCLHFANRQDGANYEGHSQVRSAYTWIRAAVEFLKSALLHRQRFGRGIPIIEKGPTARSSKETSQANKKAMQDYFNAKDAFFAVPEGTKLKILQMQEETSLVGFLEFCMKQARAALGASYFDLGTHRFGSFALSNDKRESLHRALAGFASGPESAWDNLAVRYVDAFYGTQAVYPRLRITNILPRSPEELLFIWQSVFGLESAYDISETDRNLIREPVGLPLVQGASRPPEDGGEDAGDAGGGNGSADSDTTVEARTRALRRLEQFAAETLQ
tara:strand:- start:2240 stop:4069 length:1830 start_codon:yes stop_codon:yes gene_type:complete